MQGKGDRELRGGEGGPKCSLLYAMAGECKLCFSRIYYNTKQDCQALFRVQDEFDARNT